MGNAACKWHLERDLGLPPRSTRPASTAAAAAAVAVSQSSRAVPLGCGEAPPLVAWIPFTIPFTMPLCLVASLLLQQQQQRNCGDDLAVTFLTNRNGAVCDRAWDSSSISIIISSEHRAMRRDEAPRALADSARAVFDQGTTSRGGGDSLATCDEGRCKEASVRNHETAECTRRAVRQMDLGWEFTSLQSAACIVWIGDVSGSHHPSWVPDYRWHAAS
ncbi:unnamed protein product [Lampetra planeri]